MAAKILKKYRKHYDAGPPDLPTVPTPNEYLRSVPRQEFFEHLAFQGKEETET